MKELSEILYSHAKRYPLMNIEDAVLIAYENEYGPGNSKESEENIREGLRTMYRQANEGKENTDGIILAEKLGNDYVRVYLNTVPESAYSRLEDAYVETVSESNGSHYFLAPKLYELIDVAGEGAFGFGKAEFCEFMLDYETDDYPMPEHSKEYQKNYNCNYCIISLKKINCTFDLKVL